MKFNGQHFPKGLSLIIGIYSLGFLGGTFTHAFGLWQRGFLATTAAPLVFNLYWDSLTLWDPLTVLLLWTRPRLGISLACLIMLTDIAINTYAYIAGYFGPPVPGMVSIWLLMQSLFGVFVFTTAPLAWAKSRPLLTS